MLFLGPKLNHIFLVLLPWVFIVLQNRFLVIKISTSAGYFGLADHFCWWNPTCCCLDPYFRWATVTMLSYDSPAQKRRRTHAPVRPVVRPRWWRYPRQPGGCRMAWRAAEVLPKKKNRMSSNPRLYLRFGTLWSSSLHHLWKMFVKVTHFITWNEAVRDDGPCNNFWIGPHSTQLWWGRGSFVAASVSKKRSISAASSTLPRLEKLIVHCNVCKKSPFFYCVEILSTSAPWCHGNQIKHNWIAIVGRSTGLGGFAKRGTPWLGKWGLELRISIDSIDSRYLLLIHLFHIDIYRHI